MKQAELNGLLAKYRRYRGNDFVLASQTERQVAQAKFELTTMGDQNSISKIAAPVKGIAIETQPKLEIGQYVEPGGEVFRIGEEGWVVKAVANDKSLADIRPQIGQEVHCRFLADSSVDCLGEIRSVSASGNSTVPYRALTHLAGGFIPVADDSLEATEPFLSWRSNWIEISKRSF